MGQTSVLLAEDDAPPVWEIVNKFTEASRSELAEQTLQPPFHLIIDRNDMYS